MAEEEGKSIHIRFRTIIEVLGKPKEHAENALKEYIEHIKEDRDLIVIKEEFSEADEKEGHWVQFVEMEAISKGLPKLISFCFEYMPSSIEILKPESFVIVNAELSGFLNDLQARLHNVDMVVKQLKNENIFIRRNMNILLKNTIMLLVKIGKTSIDELAEFTGVEKSELVIFIDVMIKENKIKKDGDGYSIVQHE